MNTPTAQEIVRNLEHKINGNGYLIKCPSPTHKGDRSDFNCSIADGDSGYLVTHCFSHNCKHVDILQGLGIEMNTNNKPKEICICTYKSADGRKKDVYRTDLGGGKKEFRQDPKGSGKGFHLHLWGKDNGNQAIIICEGEKAAAALKRHLEEIGAQNEGIPASYIGGWNNAKNADYSICKGRRVTSWPDNDNEGITAGSYATQGAKKAGATVIKMVDVSKMPHKGDAADVDTDTAIKMLVDAKEWKEEEQPKSDPNQFWQQGQGRPKSDNPSKKTEQNQRSQKRLELRNIAFDFGFPQHLLIEDWIEADVERIWKYTSNNFYYTGKSVLISNQNVWTELRKDKPEVVSSIIDNVRSKAARELEEWADKVDEITLSEYSNELRNSFKRSRHTQDVMFTLIEQAPNGDRTQKESITKFDKRNTHPILPLNDGTAIDITTRKIIESDQALAHKYIDHEWNIEPPNFDLLESEKDGPMAKIIEEHYGIELFERLATALLGTDKYSDSFIIGTDGGKSTLVDIMAEAFPNAVDTRNTKKVFSAKEERFTPAADPLSKCLWTFFDEAGQQDATIPTSQVNEQAQDMITLHPKFGAMTSARRVSCSVFIGHDWPRVNFSDQGIKTRFVWGHDRRGAGKIDAQTRASLLMPLQTDYLRAWIINKAHELWTEHGSGYAARIAQNESDSNAIGKMKSARSDKFVNALQENFTAKKHKKVKAEDVNKVLESVCDEDEKPPSTRALKTTMEKAFEDHEIVSKRLRVEGEMNFYWIGIVSTQTPQQTTD